LIILTQNRYINSINNFFKYKKYKRYLHAKTEGVLSVTATIQIIRASSPITTHTLFYYEDYIAYVKETKNI